MSKIMLVEKMLRKLIILSAGILNFATKLSFKAMNQRYILASIVKWYCLSSELLIFDQVMLLWN